MQIPQELIDSLKKINHFDQEAFVNVHAHPQQITSVRINPAKFSTLDFSLEEKVPWTEYGYYLPARPSFTFDPLFHAGCYYVQEASSMFLEQAFRQAVDLNAAVKVLDLSAAPGGKSTHIQSLLNQQSLLVSNEVIRARAQILKDNIVKWGTPNVVVTNNDPADFQRIGEYFDVIVVDAPCSGSGLFRRDPEAIEEWSLQNVTLCSQRQQRILADILPVLKPGGILIYSTCSYSQEEDEDIVKWMNAEFSLTTIPLSIHETWNIVESGGGYRFWPDRLKGEGFFLACFQKNEGADRKTSFRIKNPAEKLTKQEVEIAQPWLTGQDWKFVKNQQLVYGWPQQFYEDFNLLLNALRVVYSGTILGELMRDKIVPAHPLAMSPFIREQLSSLNVDKEDAILFLQRAPMNVEINGKGWQLVKYRDHALGWANVLPNRINNYYPKELRILKANPD